jgi:hypothetical protein
MALVARQQEVSIYSLMSPKISTITLSFPTSTFLHLNFLMFESILLKTSVMMRVNNKLRRLNYGSN